MAPRAAAPFVPLSPTISISQLLLTTPNFRTVRRIDAKQINESNIGTLPTMIHEHVIQSGKPLVLENWHQRPDWPRWVFNPDWLKENHGTDRIQVTDLNAKLKPINMSIGHYYDNLGRLTSKFAPSDYDGRQQRLYAKDLDCPPVWHQSLNSILPESTFYLNPKADLMSSLPKPARAENMMCYVGHEGTYTPAHKEMCGSLGQNIMVYASKNGPNSETGSSIWFMTETKDRDLVREYWLGTLGHDIEVESHFASLEDLRRAPFTVWVVEQKLGDYILIPPLAPHQVWNRGTCTMKAAWNRTTVDTLELAVDEALPGARLVCRDEQYHNKAMIYDTLKRYTNIFGNGSNTDWKHAPPTIEHDYLRLYKLFTQLMLDECHSPLLPVEKVQMIPNEYNVQCSFCRANIWNRFLTCKTCIVEAAEGEDPEPYDVCMECYASGRSCACISGQDWVEQHPWQGELLLNHEKFRQQYVEIERHTTEHSPLGLKDLLASVSQKTLARICQEELRKRRWRDPEEDVEEDDPKEIAIKKKKGQLLNCHVCKIRHDREIVAMCSNKNCARAYCYGSLWRAFDMDPYKDVLAKFHWKCPVCLGICSCGACRKRGDMNPYIPKGTVLGVVTKHVADVRSVEYLVDFARGNISWTGNGITGSKRRRSEDEDGEGDDEDVLEKWGTVFQPSVPNTPRRQMEDGLEDDYDGDQENMMYAQQQDMYKAHERAAGLDVVAIPIDPALSGEPLDDERENSGLISASYARLFENPPEPEEQARECVEAVLRDDLPGSSSNNYRNGFLPSSDGMINGAPAISRHHYDDKPDDLINPQFSNLSNLELNPLQFAAEAGLRVSEQFTNGCQNQYNNQDDPNVENYDQAEHSPQSPSFLGTKRKGKRKDDGARVVGDLPQTVAKPSIIENWVHQNKLAMKHKHKKKKLHGDGSLTLVLRISPDAWRRREEDEARKKEAKTRKVLRQYGNDEVMSDLKSVNKRKDAAAANGKTQMKARRKVPEDIVPVESDDEESEEDIFAGITEEVIPKKKNRRTGELVEGLKFTPRKRIGSMVEPASASTRSYRRKSMLSQAVQRSNCVEVDDGQAADAHTALDTQIAIEIDEEGDLSEEVMFEDAPAESDSSLPHISNEPSELGTEPEMEPEPQPTEEFETESEFGEDNTMNPGTEAYKRRIAQELREVKSIAAKAFEAAEEEESYDDDSSADDELWYKGKLERVHRVPKVIPAKSAVSKASTTPIRKSSFSVQVMSPLSKQSTSIPTTSSSVPKRPRLPPGMVKSKKIISGTKSTSSPSTPLARSTPKFSASVSGFTALNADTATPATKSIGKARRTGGPPIPYTTPTVNPNGTPLTTSTHAFLSAAASSAPSSLQNPTARKRKLDITSPDPALATKSTRSIGTRHADEYGEEDNDLPALTMAGSGEQLKRRKSLKGAKIFGNQIIRERDDIGDEEGSVEVKRRER